MIKQELTRTNNIIQRRDLDPLWSKAMEIAQHYETAGDCIASVMGTNCSAAGFFKHPKALLFCSLCIRQKKQASETVPHDYPCFLMHHNAVEKARKLGGVYIYTCPVGYSFWTSPFFAGDRYAGAFISSVIPADSREEALNRLFDICKGNISRAEIARHIDEAPAKTVREIQMLARMMVLCAERVTNHGSYWLDEGYGGEPDSFDCDSRECQPKEGLIDLLDRERQFFASLRRGDRADALNMVEDMLGCLNTDGDDNLDQLKLKAVELVVLLSRNGADLQNGEESSGADSRFIARIMDSKTAKEITENLRLVIERMTGIIFSFRGVRHASALRKAERFIWENYTRKISLKEVADASGLSAPYFSTVFKDEMGENFSNYLNRLRVEKASALLRETEYPINRISSVCGFDDQSWFSKIFKIYTGISPCRYRETGGVLLPKQNSWTGQVYLN